MQLRNFSAGTQRSYVHYLSDFAKHYGISPETLGLDDIRNYELHLIEQRQLSPQSINCFVSAVKFLYQVTLEMPWSDAQFTRLKASRHPNHPLQRPRSQSKQPFKRRNQTNPTSPPNKPA